MARVGLAAVLLSAIASSVGAADAPEGYAVEVWADVLFDTEGRVQRIDIPPQEGQPEDFVDRVKKMLAGARVPPPRDDRGAPATLQSGVNVWLRVTSEARGGSGGASARITGLDISPRIVKRYAASAPQGIAAGGTYDARVRCTVTVEGRCRDMAIDYTTLVNEPFRRWALASAAGYQFEPQRVNGKPIESEITVSLRLTVDDSMPKEFRQYQQAR